MKLRGIVTVAGFLAATTVMPLGAVTRTPADEGAELLKAVQADTYNILNHADSIVSYERTPQISWQSHADALASIKASVNDMGKKMIRLEVLKPDLPEWQRESISRAEPAIREFAMYTQKAMQFVNKHQDDFWTADYSLYTNALDSRAGVLYTSLHNFEKLAKTSRVEARLEQELGVKKAD